MAGKVSIEFDGVQAVKDVYKELGAAFTKQVLQDALRTPAKDLVKEYQRTAPYDPDRTSGKHLRDSFTIRKSPGRSKLNGHKPAFAEIYVGTTARHAHLIEFGHNIVNKKGQVVGFAPPRPFMRQALRLVSTNMPEVLGKSLKKSIEKIVTKLSKQVKTGKFTRSTMRAAQQVRG